MHWGVNEKELVLMIDDNGPGFLNPSNAFVPFYTTKPAGSGIGLVLCRQIAEAHGGSIELLNLSDKKGAGQESCCHKPSLLRSRGSKSWVDFGMPGSVCLNLSPSLQPGRQTRIRPTFGSEGNWRSVG